MGEVIEITVERDAGPKQAAEKLADVGINRGRAALQRRVRVIIYLPHVPDSCNNWQLP